MYYTVTASTDLTTRPKRLHAWHFKGVAACVIRLRDGGVAGPIVAEINLATDTSASQCYDLPQGLMFPAGVYVQVVSGTVVGSVDLL